MSTIDEVYHRKRPAVIQEFAANLADFSVWRTDRGKAAKTRWKSTDSMNNRSSVEPWAYVPVGWQRRCPHGEGGAFVLESGTDRCLSHGHQRLSEAIKWARKHKVELVLTDDQAQAVECWADREGYDFKEGSTAEVIELLFGTSDSD